MVALRIWRGVVRKVILVALIFGILSAAGWPGRAEASGAEEIPGILFRESFDDDQLLTRGWYDGKKFAISRKEAFAGEGCIGYRWEAGGLTPASSDGIRHLFKPTEVVYLRFYIKFFPGWGWSGRNYHPHLIHLMTPRTV